MSFVAALPAASSHVQLPTAGYPAKRALAQAPSRYHPATRQQVMATAHRKVKKHAGPFIPTARSGPDAHPDKPAPGGPKARAYNALIHATLHTLYGGLTVVSAGMRLAYEKKLMPEGTKVTRNIPYHDAESTRDAAQVLDVLAPVGQNLPVVIYMHGGAFVHGSKETHWMMPVKFLQMGCLVVSINYRLAPQHKYPAALEDACEAVGWVIDNIADYGGDPNRLILAGDSAGGNLVTAACACMCWERPEPFARALFDRGITPKAVLPHGATYSMSKFDDEVPDDPQARAAGVLRHVNNFYLRPKNERQGDITLADPLTLCAPKTPPARPLPPFFIAAGTKDPLLADGVHAAACLKGAGAEVRTEAYEGGVHVFHALYFFPSRYREQAEAHWADMAEFLQKQKLLPQANVTPGA